MVWCLAEAWTVEDVAAVVDGVTLLTFMVSWGFDLVYVAAGMWMVRRWFRGKLPFDK